MDEEVVVCETCRGIIWSPEEPIHGHEINYVDTFGPSKSAVMGMGVTFHAAA